MKVRFPFPLFLYALLTIPLLPQAAVGQGLKVSENGRYLIYEDGKPFFYLGDTAWELFHRLTLEEAGQYLTNRSEKGFTVIQAVVLAQLGGLTVANANGHLPLEDNDPTRPVEAYFKHVDAIVDKAQELGLFVGILPAWGSYWSATNSNTAIFSVENARSYGAFLGRRYREKPVIWILGGDENINNESEKKIIEAMAEGLKAGDGGRHLITFHPRGPGRSSDYFHQVAWLDFNMSQSSHAAHDHDNGLFAESDYRLTPAKPTLDAEPRYELIPAGFYFNGANRLDLFDDYDCRQAAYWSVLAGACGHTYGHNSIWQMWAPGREAVLSAVVPWYEAIHHPGSFQMGIMRRFFDLRPFNKLVPDQSLILAGPTTGGAKIRAAIADDATFAVYYSPRGEPFTVDQDRIKTKLLKALWFDPRYGIFHHIHTGNTLSIQTYTPPTIGRGHDWILVLEDANLNLPLPESRN